MRELGWNVAGALVIFGAYILGFWMVVVLTPFNWLYERRRGR